MYRGVVPPAGGDHGIDTTAGHRERAARTGDECGYPGGRRESRRRRRRLDGGRFGHEPGETVEGKDAYRACEAALRRGLPDLEGDIDLPVSDEDLVAVRYTAGGTHRGEL
jgi:hypothetical protein